MKKREIPDRIISWVRSQKNDFGADELSEATGISHRSASIYLSRLEKTGILTRRIKGRYISFSQRPSVKVRKLGNIISRELPFTAVVLWSTDTIIHFLQNMPNRHQMFLETEKDDVSSVHDVLKEHGIRVKARPSRADFEAANDDGIDVFVLAKKERYGTRLWKGKIFIAGLEKVFIDLYVLASRRGLPYPKEEITRALETAMDENAVSRNTLRKYSKRRYVYPDLRRLIEGVA
jgi:DNA-binding transcriptional ArsR family regulator